VADVLAAESGILTRRPTASPQKWYVAHVKSHHENNVATELTIRGVDNYLPCYEELHEWKDRRQSVRLPLFPGYVFTRFFDSPETRLSILRTNGIVRLLGLGKTIEAVPDPEMEAVRRLVESTLPCYAHPFLREGDRIRVKRGPLRGTEGFLVRVKNHTRLVVSVSLLSRSVAAEVNLRDIDLF
jgi:transcription termination/antitermination protein NusG